MLTETSTLSGLDFACAGAPSSAHPLNRAIALARTRLLSLQNDAGYWVFELEADCTIPAEYILMMHYMDEINVSIQAKIANFIRTQQSADGSFPLYKGGAGANTITTPRLAGTLMPALHSILHLRSWHYCRLTKWAVLRSNPG